jgi:hypothetical protein
VERVEKQDKKISKLINVVKELKKKATMSDLPDTVIQEPVMENKEVDDYTSPIYSLIGDEIKCIEQDPAPKEGADNRKLDWRDCKIQSKGQCASGKPHFRKGLLGAWYYQCKELTGYEKKTIQVEKKQ